MAYINVIIPVYNAEAYLKEAVASVLEQPFQDTHIVLIDDGSTDNSGAICDELAVQESRVTVIHQRNAGVSAARNAGIEFCVNENTVLESYIAFLDADDVWYTGFLTDALIEYIKKNGYDVFAFGMMNCDYQKTRFSRPKNCIHETIAGGNDAIWRITNHFGSCIYSAALLKKWNIRFFNRCKYSEDKYFRMQCSFFADYIEFMPQMMYIYRENRTGAMSASEKLKPIDYYLPIIDGWIKSDDSINSHFQRTGNRIDAGYTLANVYFLDMSAAHFKRWGSSKELFDIMKSHPHYPAFYAMKSMGDNDRNYKNHNLLFQHPYVYEWKYRVLGMLEKSVRVLMKLPFVRVLNTWRKFPFKKMP